ncbi:Auxin efflux carrier family protein [hydrothermal vent metagenome]|uniref:Auxin efflux carrier family protein n=1 Tax=hydrothermal vent metagenome TaxID=652676 RepID=A0A3B0RXY5_9ZZZZ
MIAVFESILPIFAIVVLGFALRKSDFVPAEHWRVVEELCFWIFFPAILALTMINADLSSVELGAFTLTLSAVLATVGLLTLSYWPVLKRTLGTSKPQYSTIYQTTTRWHGFIALAIVLKLFGDDGAALVAVYFVISVPVLQISNILVLVAFSKNARKGSRIDFRQIGKTIIINPIIWGVLGGFAVNLSGVTVWDPVMTGLDLLGRAALGTSLLALGAGLSLKAALRPSKELLIGVVGKLLITPLVAVGWALVFGVSGMALSVLLVGASVPTAMNGYLLAKKMGGDADLYAATSTVQTVVSFFTIPLILWLAQNWAGAL